MRARDAINESRRRQAPAIVLLGSCCGNPPFVMRTSHAVHFCAPVLTCERAAHGSEVAHHAIVLKKVKTRKWGSELRRKGTQLNRSTDLHRIVPLARTESIPKTPCSRGGLRSVG